jgi:hypothetical protein
MKKFIVLLSLLAIVSCGGGDASMNDAEIVAPTGTAS